jgi:hypothetical protein
MAGGAAVRRVEDLLKRLRAGPRLLCVVTDDSDAVDALLKWARTGGATAVVLRSDDRFDLRIYLLPGDFDGHPLLAWRPTLPAHDVTPEGMHLTVG